MSAGRRVSIAIVALSLLGPGRSLAQSPRPGSAAPVDPARALFDEGVHAMEDGRFADALERLEQARQIRETPALVFNIAIAQRGLGHYVDAVAGLERYIAMASDRIDPQRRADIDTLLGELRRSVSHARIHSSVPDATITVDGHPITASLAAPIDLDPGTHAFHATLDGYNAIESTQITHAGESIEVTLTLERIASIGFLRVESPLAESRVYLDHHLVGTGVYEATIPAGSHEIEVRAAGYVTYSRTVLMRTGGRETVHVSLDHTGSLATRWWLWTAVGVVVVGGVTAAVIATQLGHEPNVAGTAYDVQAVTVAPSH